MKPTTLLPALALAAFLAPPVLAQDVKPAAVVAGGDATIVYVFPTSPQSFAPVEGLPSFLLMPGAPLPAIATQVVYSTPAPVGTTQVAAVDVDCSDFVGEVTIAGADLFNLDRDGDGIGCEPEDR